MISTFPGEEVRQSGYTKWDGGIVSLLPKCGALTPTGELTNRNCEEALPFVCERDIT